MEFRDKERGWGLGLGVFKKSENEKVGKGGKIGHRPALLEKIFHQQVLNVLLRRVAQDWPHVDLRKTRVTGTQGKRERGGREEWKEEE